MSEVRFMAADHVISIETDSEVLLRYFRWKTALLAADELPADIKVRILTENRPEGKQYALLNDTDDGNHLDTSLWKNTETGEYGIHIPKESLGTMIEQSSMLANRFASILAEHDTLLLHSCGLVCGNKGVLIAGYPGMGKSTLAVSSLQRGAGYLSDDTVWLHKGIMYPVESTIHPERGNPGKPLEGGMPFKDEPGTDHKHHLDLTGLEEQYVRKVPVGVLIGLRRDDISEPEVQKASPKDFVYRALLSSVRVLNPDNQYLGQFRKETAYLYKLPAYLIVLCTDTDKNAEMLEKLVKGDNHVSFE